jgi:hypothetical protein
VFSTTSDGAGERGLWLGRNCRKHWNLIGFASSIQDLRQDSVAGTGGRTWQCLGHWGAGTTSRHLPGRPGELRYHRPAARRSSARIYYDAKAPIKQIQFLLGHDKLDTTARYVNDEQKFGGEAVSKVADIS